MLSVVNAFVPTTVGFADFIIAISKSVLFDDPIVIVPVFVVGSISESFVVSVPCVCFPIASPVAGVTLTVYVPGFISVIEYFPVESDVAVLTNVLVLS